MQHPQVSEWGSQKREAQEALSTSYPSTTTRECLLPPVPYQIFTVTPHPGSDPDRGPIEHYGTTGGTVPLQVFEPYLARVAAIGPRLETRHSHQMPNA